MRNVITISLPEKTLKAVKKEIKDGGYATTSEFFRHLLRLWSEHQLAHDLLKRKKEFEAGKGKVLGSLKDLR